MRSPQLQQDRRLTPRLPCHLAIANEGAVIGEVQDISVGGIRLCTTSQLLQNYQYEFQLLIPSSKHSLNFRGRITYRQENTYGVKIEKVDRKSKRFFEKYVVSLRESCQIRDIIGNLKTNKNTLTIDDPKVITQLIRKAKEDGLSLKISLVDFYQPLLATITSLEDDSLVLKLKSRVTSLRSPNHFYIVVMISYHSYYLECNFLKKNGDHLLCSLPSKVYFSDRRREERLLFEKSDVKVIIRGPLTTEIEGRLIDYSSNGAKIRVPLNVGMFFLRTPLEHVKLNNSSGVKKAIVRSVRLSVSDYQDIGVQLVDDIRSEDFTVNPVASFRRGNFFDKYVKKAIDLASFLLHKIKPAKVVQAASTFRPVIFNNTQGQKVAALLDTSFDITEKVKTPMVIVIPAWGAKKESFSALAAVITHNFREKGQPVSVLRFDLTNHLGESYKDPEAQEPGKESLNVTPAGNLSDIKGAIAFAKNNPLVSVGPVIFISFSFSAPMARRIILEDGGQTDHPPLVAPFKSSQNRVAGLIKRPLRPSWVSDLSVHCEVG